MKPEGAPDLETCLRLAQRLMRLFRIERAGAVRACAPAIERRLLARRAAVVDALSAGLQRRRIGGLPASEALDAALRQLGAEVRRSRHQALARLERLEIELRLRHGGGRPSGVRGGGGHLLGRG